MNRRERYLISSAVFVILRDKGKICMLRRKNTGWMDGWFSIPAGGLEAGETIAAAAARELREEAGVSAELADLRLVHTLHARTGDQAWLGHFFLTDRWQGAARIMESEKHDNLQWHHLDTLPDNTIPYVRQALQCIRDGQSWSAFGFSGGAS